jgi:hypothetical protein
MADDSNKKTSEQSGYKQGQKSGQESEQQQENQQDISKRNPSGQEQNNEEQDDQQQARSVAPPSLASHLDCFSGKRSPVRRGRTSHL